MEENSFGLSSHLMVEKGYDVNYNYRNEDD